MLWFTVWTVLVVATLGGAFLLGRRLWRSVVALGAELARAGDVAQQVSERAAQLEALARAEQTVSGPALGADADALRDRVEQLRAQRRERAALRRARHRTTVADARTRWFG
ncbi:conserved hypothetical protein [Cellulomonas flavigena DSM 20109]|uniref:Uncharacterized protein n=1 Tax=Cellulomonas flavigena (strain ATCC 482 / DSM 20109 / BCRC 11376 / JCM 18109 / NBRC 3775 / NCIMB 8073 / NRS 134) TaxID=446466 RepID=D5UEV5_CELFN|nr:hypothetical protein [Cellulomonas flavigena]ADG74765.1 conserved hypothetical protein [Cellulomonas flavigena DSM 20109]